MTNSVYAISTTYEYHTTTAAVSVMSRVWARSPRATNITFGIYHVFDNSGDPWGGIVRHRNLPFFSCTCTCVQYPSSSEKAPLLTINTRISSSEKNSALSSCCPAYFWNYFLLRLNIVLVVPQSHHQYLVGFTSSENTPFCHTVVLRILPYSSTVRAAGS